METTNTTQEEVMATEEALQTIELAYKAFDAAGRTRTFMTLGGQYLMKEFNFRGIYQTYKVSGYTYLSKHLSNPESDKNAVAVHGMDKVTTFLNALNEEILADSNLNDIVTQLQAGEEVTPQPLEGSEETKPSSEFEQAIKEAGEQVAEEMKADNIEQAAEQAHNVAEQVAPAMPALKQEVSVPAPAPVLNQPKHGLLLDVDSILRQSAENFLTGEKSEVMAFVQEKMQAQLLNNTLVILPTAKAESKTEVIVTGRLHASYKECLEVLLIESQAYFAGPTGSGKTTVAEQIAETLQLPFGHISVTAGMSEAHLLGRMIADGSYISSRLVDLYENGGVFLADEVDAADPNTTLILNSALANGILSVPNRKEKPYARRHPKFYFIAAANTWGNGSTEYTGRNQQDGAFMDRFAMSKVEVDYDTDLERDILKVNPAFAKKLFLMRESIQTNRVKKHLSTRVFAAAARGFAAGLSEATLLKRFFIGWSQNEIDKVLS